MRLATLLIALATMLPTIPAAQAIEEEPRIFRGVRSEGMGGLITTTGNYSEALFGNPARHAEVDNWKLTLLETQFEVNSTLLSTSSDFSALRSSSGASSIANASKLIGKTEHIAMQSMILAYYNPKLIDNLAFAVGLYGHAHADVAVNYTTDIDNQIIFDIGPNFGFAYPFLDNTLTVGLNLHLLYRVASDGLINSLTLLNGGKLTLQNFGRQGVGVDSDIGAYYHVPWELPFMRIEAGASINGLFKSHYPLQAGLMAGMGTMPINNDRLLNMGLRFDFPDTSIFTAPIFALEFQDIGDTQKDVSFGKKTHFGTEAKLSRVISLRAGFNQGYVTLGLGIDLPVLKLDFATYGEELSGTAGQREDRRYMARMAFEL